MPLHHKPQRGEPRLRVIFADGPIALGMPVGSTLADVADRVDHIARQHNGSLLSIDVSCAPSRSHSGRDALTVSQSIQCATARS